MGLRRNFEAVKRI